MRAITTFQVVDCNKELEAGALGWRVRLHDACGRQTLSIEPADSRDAPTADGEAARAAVINFFANAGVPVEFAEDGPTCWAAV